MIQTATAIQQEDGVHERAAEAAGAADGAFGLNPFVGFTGEDIRATLARATTSTSWGPVQAASPSPRCSGTWRRAVIRGSPRRRCW
jgi:hypothetical protein